MKQRKDSYSIHSPLRLVFPLSRPLSLWLVIFIFAILVAALVGLCIIIIVVTFDVQAQTTLVIILNNKKSEYECPVQ